jgi:acetyl esterase/lipase
MQSRIALASLAVLLSVAAQAGHLGPRDVAQRPASAPTLTEFYGPDPLQTGELRLPIGKGPFPLAIIIHGGCFTKGFATATYMAPLASALTAKGIATWNIEYRQVGDPGGGWPGTYLDWGAAADHVTQLAKRYPLNLNRIVAVGHSAGATAAVWIAARRSLPSTSEVRGVAPLKLAAAVAIDGPVDLAGWIGADQQICGQPVVANLLGGMPQAVPDRFAQGSPIALVPIKVPQFLIVSTVLTDGEARHYRHAAKAAGDQVAITHLKNAGHFDMLAPGGMPWATVEQVILRALEFK